MGIRYNLENKGNFIAGVLLSPLWFIMQLVLLEALFLHTDSFLGYSKEELFFLYGVYKLITHFGGMFFYEKLANLNGLIRGDDGTLDMVITKPIDSQVYATTGSFAPSQISALILAFYVVINYWSVVVPEVDIIKLTVFIIFCAAGLMIYYSTFLLISAVAFWADITGGPLIDIWLEMRALSKYQRTLFRGWLEVSLSFIFPFLLGGSLQVDYLLKDMPLIQVAIYIVVAVVFLVIARFAWLQSVKRYSGSGS